MDDIRWRSAIEPRDVRAIRELVEASGAFTKVEVEIAVEVAEESLLRGEASGYHAVLAADDEGLAGYAVHGPIPGTDARFDLYWIVVAPRRQRGGLGRALLRRVELDAVARGARRLFIETSSTPPYAPARALFERCGYALVATLPDYYRDGDAKLVYARAL